MKEFIPRRVFYEEKALEYPLGRELVATFRKMGVETLKIASHNRVTGIPGKTPREAYREGKRTLVIGVRREKEFQTCKPSAHYQLPLVTGCSGMCEYCYLATNLGKKPYIRIYVNVEEILATARQLIHSRIPEVTLFEGSAVSDPLPVEPYTSSLQKTIEFFSREEYGRFRFVTKFTDVDSLLDLNHQNRTTIRFSLNSQKIIQTYEHGTPPIRDRIAAAQKVFRSGYELGFLIAPIVAYPGWQEGYQQLFRDLAESFREFPSSMMEKLSLELISHRYTSRAKINILEIFPATDLNMEETDRKFKYGQFGYGKYVYKPDIMEELKATFYYLIAEYLPGVQTLYFV